MYTTSTAQVTSSDTGQLKSPASANLLVKVSRQMSSQENTNFWSCDEEKGLVGSGSCGLSVAFNYPTCRI